mgnify:FL=1
MRTSHTAPRGSSQATTNPAAEVVSDPVGESSVDRRILLSISGIRSDRLGAVSSAVADLSSIFSDATPATLIISPQGFLPRARSGEQKERRKPWRLLADRKTQEFLRSYRLQGGELSLAGLGPRVVGGKLKKKEFAGLGGHESRLRLRAALHQCRALELQPAVFTPHRWVASHETLAIARQLGLWVTADAEHISAVPRGSVTGSAGSATAPAGSGAASTGSGAASARPDTAISSGERAGKTDDQPAVLATRVLSLGEGAGASRAWRGTVEATAKRQIDEGKVVRLSISAKKLAKPTARRVFMDIARTAAAAGYRPASYSGFVAAHHNLASQWGLSMEEAGRGGVLRKTTEKRRADRTMVL